ncbi:FxsA family membrane protein [Actinacidiphila sp. ITFR-21]|uniref:FxsA family membrane protein n=1 Tax=Actinacidiphila sp. ITFR-21 TaxID=3075199 RepID=UPI002889D1F9|nr:FxsA family membrane protein [Streptomyces sp. ITFR-21]WNI14584.1 FxsA family membrane protein [Streptomyces sp. ITFR-21]
MTSSSPPPARQQQANRPARRRSRARTAVPLALAVWAALEIWLLVVVADAAGGFVVLLCLLAGLVLGAAAVKRAGRSAWRNLTATLQQPGTPGAPPAEGAPALPAAGSRAGLHMLGGVLLIIPGFVSDAVALLLLFPPTRKLTGRGLDRLLLRRVASAGDPGSIGDLFQQAREADERSRIHRPDGKVIQGEVVDPDDKR